MAPVQGLRDVVQGRPSQTTRGWSGPWRRAPSESSDPPELRDTEKLSSLGTPPNVAVVLLGAAEAGGPPGYEEERGCSLSVPTSQGQAGPGDEEELSLEDAHLSRSQAAGKGKFPAIQVPRFCIIHRRAGTPAIRPSQLHSQGVKTPYSSMLILSLVLCSDHGGEGGGGGEKRGEGEGRGRNRPQASQPHDRDF